MSPKHIEIDPAIEALKLEASTPAMQLKARQVLANPKRSSIMPKFALAVLPAVFAGVLLWPHGSAGMAWGQVVSDSVNAPIVHSVTRYKNGVIASEEWTQSNKQVWVLYDPKGRVINEWRTDGERTFNYFNLLAGDTRKGNPNRRVYGDVYHRTSTSGSLTHPIGGTLKDLLGGKEHNIKSQTKLTVNGREITKFVVAQIKPFPDEFIAKVDDNTGLIFEISRLDGNFVRKIDYPKSVPAMVFNPSPQRIKNIEVYDQLEQKNTIKARVNRGLGTDKGVTLRLVALDYSGGLWVFWTGQPVDGQMLRPYTSSGLILGKPYGLRKFTTSADGKNDRPISTGDGQRLYGMAREAKTKVGSTVNISIPTANGISNFKNVPVLRIGMPNGVAPWHTFEPGDKPFG